jgi:metal-responsive CopG/Arc/MetJ family transcriptional regulator
MKARTMRISIEARLLERVDEDPETREKGRSAFIRSAVRHYLLAKELEGSDARIRAAYDGKADEMLAEIAGLLDGRAWPSG